MIALTSCVGKLYHQLLANRIIDFLTTNKLLDSDTQKAFIPKVNGCVEHGYVLQEAIAHSRRKKNTLHCTFFDLADAFGSVNHELIKYTLKRNHLPECVSTYITNLYSRLSGVITGPSWTTTKFPFRTGTFQGDPLSPVIFILVFNPIIQYLKLKEDRYGYKLNGNSVITLPYADDFNLITNNKRTHQRLINELHSITSSMNLTLKPEKCKNLSICSGFPKIVPFSLGGKDLDSIKNSPMKFLGACVSFQSTSMEGFTFIHNKLESMLKNIESTNIRPEFKVRIYTQYAMSSIRFALTLHDLTSTQRKSLDSLTTRYLKSWLGMPRCGATSAIIYSSVGLNIQSMSHLYFQCHSLSIARTLERADIRTTQALNTKLRREEHFVRKDLGNTRAHQFYQEAITLGTNSLTTLKTKIKSAINADQSKAWLDHLKKLVVQGDLLNLAHSEESDITWRSAIYSLPRRVLSFAINSSIDTLPTFRNLKLWGKKMSSNSKLCGNTQTLLHVLAGCKTMLDQGRYTWRHNCVLNHIEMYIRGLTNNANIISDLPGRSLSGLTIPPEVPIVTSARPDLVIHYSDANVIKIIELTVPFETNIEKEHTFKTNKYATLIQDIKDKQISSELTCVEVGCRGYVSESNKIRLTTILKSLDIKPSKRQVKELTLSLSKLALLTSFVIFKCKDEPEWFEPKLIVE